MSKASVYMVLPMNALDVAVDRAAILDESVGELHEKLIEGLREQHGVDRADLRRVEVTIQVSAYFGPDDEREGT